MGLETAAAKEGSRELEAPGIRARVVDQERSLVIIRSCLAEHQVVDLADMSSEPGTKKIISKSVGEKWRELLVENTRSILNVSQDVHLLSALATDVLVGIDAEGSCHSQWDRVSIDTVLTQAVAAAKGLGEGHVLDLVNVDGVVRLAASLAHFHADGLTSEDIARTIASTAEAHQSNQYKQSK